DRDTVLRRSDHAVTALADDRDLSGHAALGLDGGASDSEPLELEASRSGTVSVDRQDCFALDSRFPDASAGLHAGRRVDGEQEMLPISQDLRELTHEAALSGSSGRLAHRTMARQQFPQQRAGNGPGELLTGERPNDFATPRPASRTPFVHAEALPQPADR